MNFNRLSFVLLLLALVVSPAYYGCVTRSPTWLVFGLTVTAALFALPTSLSRLQFFLILLGLVPPLVALLQIIPLPVDVVSLFSPASGEAFRDAGFQVGRISLNPDATLQFLALWGTGFFGFVAAWGSVTGRRRFRIFLVTILVSSCVYALWGIFGVVGYHSRAHLPYVSSAHYGFQMGVALLCALVFLRLFSDADRGVVFFRRPTVMFAFAVALLGAGMVASLSRGAVASFLPAILVLLSLRRRRKKGRAVLVAVVTAALFILFSFLGGLGPIIERFEKAPTELTVGRGLAWATTVKAIPHYMPFGCGLLAFRWGFSPFKDSPGLYGTWDEAHNDYLNLLLEGGVVAFGSVMLLVVLIFFLLKRGLGDKGRHRHAAVALALSVLFGTLLHSAVDFPLHIPSLALLFGSVLGAAFGMLGLKDDKPRTRLWVLLPSVAVCWFGVLWQVGCEDLPSRIRGGDFGALVAARRHAPFWSEPHFAAAMRLVEEKNDGAAIKHFINAIYLLPREPRYWFHYGMALGRLGDRDHAVEAFRRSVAADPTHAEILYRTGLVFVKEGFPHKESLLEEGKRLIRRACVIKRGYLRKALDEAARFSLRPEWLYTFLPDEEWARVVFVRYLAERGIWRGVARYAAALKGQTLLYARALIEMGKEDKAMEVLDGFLGRDGFSLAQAREVQRVFASTGRWDIALSFWRRRRSALHIARRMEAETLLVMGDAKAAFDALRGLTETDEVSYLRAKAALAMGRPALAASILFSLHKKRPQEFRFLALLVRALVAEGKKERAKEFLRAYIIRTGDRRAKEILASLEGIK